MANEPRETCEVCGKVSPSAEVHPCRFENACACWYGEPCKRGENIIVYRKAQKKAREATA
jgi:hypothetical protein